MLSPVLNCLFVGSLAALMTAALGVLLHRAIRIARAEGKADRATLLRIAAMWGCLGVLALSGTGITAVTIVMVIPMTSTAPASLDVSRALLVVFVRLYFFWLPTAMLAIPMTSRWGRRAFRSFPPLRRGEALGRLAWLRARRSRSATAVRAFARKYDRRLW